MEGGVVGELEDLGAVERAVEGVGVERAGEVEDGAGRRGDRDAVEGRDLVAAERRVAVDAQARPRSAAGRRHDHVDPDRVASADVPQRRGSAVEERRAGPAREDRRHPVPARPEDGVADGVDALVDAMQAAGRGPVAHPARREAERLELAARHHAVLPARDSRDLAVDRPLDELRTSDVHFSSSPGHGSTMTARASRVARALCRFCGSLATTPSRRC
jgi:hypothetical protein